MAITIRNRVGFWLRRRRKRVKPVFEPLKLMPGESTALNILILLPRSPVSVRIVKYFLKMVRPEDARMKFLCFESVRDAFDPLTRDNMIILEKTSLNWWGLPDDEFISGLFQEKYDAIVSLDPQFDPVLGTIVLSAPVSIRIGFDALHSDILYNNLLKISKHSGFVENGYLAIKKLLGL